MNFHHPILPHDGEGAQFSKVLPTVSLSKSLYPAGKASQAGERTRSVQKKKLSTTHDYILERHHQDEHATKVGVINLGCARNLVDAQMMLGRLKKNGHRIVDINQAQVAIVNTCSFIEESRQESIDVILDLLELKKQGKLKKVIVAGCLAQRYGQDLLKELRGVDAFVGTPTLPKDQMPTQYSLTPKHFAYVKICESCFNQCSFCAIPKIKGKFSSRTIESIVAEVKALDQQGVKEVNIIGQDITAYGMDIYRTKSLARLIKELLASTKNIRWFRLLYAFPAHVTDELIETIASDPRICKYIDIPHQHISDHILTDMNRSISKKGTMDLMRKIKTAIPSAAIRTTFIVGFPGETEEDFQELLNFVKEFQFERAGVFIYSKEEGTSAFHLKNHVPDKIKKERMNTLMAIQQDISKKVLERFVGQNMFVLIEDKDPTDQSVYIARSQFDAPEVDGVVYVHSKKSLKPGDFVEVFVTDSYEYDLVAKVV